MEQTPSIGRIVHIDYGEGQRREVPAIITAVHSGTMINVRVFVDGPENPPYHTSVTYEGDATSGHVGAVWRWPPRVEASPKTEAEPEDTTDETSAEAETSDTSEEPSEEQPPAA